MPIFGHFLRHESVNHAHMSGGRGLKKSCESNVGVNEIWGASDGGG